MDNIGPTWVLSAPRGPNVVPMNLAIRMVSNLCDPNSVITLSVHPYHRLHEAEGISIQDTKGDVVIYRGTVSVNFHIAWSATILMSSCSARNLNIPLNYSDAVAGFRLNCIGISTLRFVGNCMNWCSTIEYIYLYKHHRYWGISLWIYGDVRHCCFEDHIRHL